MELGSSWEAIVADDDLRRTWLDDDVDLVDGPPTPVDEFGEAVDPPRWQPITVPGHWQSTPAFADEDGALLYRNRF
ncbi:MAG: hypothetical protein ABI239_01375, partial [Aquihabitans sp.]